MNNLFLALLVSGGLGGADVLGTTDGSILRGSVRPAEGGCWVVTQAGSTFVAEGEIAWRAREEDLRAEEERLLEGAGQGTAGATRNAQVSLWCGDHGLLEDAGRLLDRAVSLDPKAPGVSRAVAGLAANLELEAQGPKGSVDRIVAFASPGAGRSLAGMAALGRIDRERVVAALARGLRASDAAVRRFASSTLGGLFPGSELSPLAGAAVADRDQEVRGNALESLRKGDGAKAAAALGPHLLSGPTSTLRRRAATALGRLGEPAAVPTLVAALRQTQAAGGARGNVFFGTQTSYVRDFDVEVAQAAAIAEPVVGVLMEGAVLDARVLAVTAERGAIVRALRTLTGANFGENAGAWEGWHRGRSAGADAKNP